MTAEKVPVRAAGGVLADLSPKRDGHDLGWLAEARLNALEWVGKNGFPSRKDEDWKYTALDEILAVPFVAAGAGPGRRATLDLINKAAIDLGGPRLVFVNGHFSPAIRCRRHDPGSRAGDEP